MLNLSFVCFTSQILNPLTSSPVIILNFHELICFLVEYYDVASPELLIGLDKVIWCYTQDLLKRQKPAFSYKYIFLFEKLINFF